MLCARVPSKTYRPTLRLRRALHASPPNLATLGLRSEDPARKWERRAALSPEAVKTLVSEGHEVLVEQCAKRAIPGVDYEQAGAILVPRLDTSRCDVVVGVKEPVPSTLASSSSPSSGKPSAHLAFFHCHKGQSYNISLLRTLLDSSASVGTRFIDYELLTSRTKGTPVRSDPTVPSAPPPAAKRVVGFGFLAGYSGMADGLAQLGTKLLAANGVPSPFLSLVRPLQAGRVEVVKRELERVGKEVGEGKMCGMDGPLVVTLSGRGKVGDGARKALDELGVRWVKADELPEIAKSGDAKTIYGCHLELGDYLVNRNGGAFDREEYRKHPEQFDSVFHSKIAPFTSVLLNGGFWAPGCPRLLTTAQLAELQKSPGNRLISIVDVSCDWEGGLEFVKSATTLDDPVVQFDASSDRLHRDPAHPTSTQLSSVEILPSAFPIDATELFSRGLLPYVRYLLEDPTLAKAGEGAGEIREALQRATLVEGGKLTEKHEWLYGLLDKASSATKRQKAVVLGAGLVAGPAVRTLAARDNLDVVVASNDLPAAEALADGVESVEPVHLDASDKAALSDLIASADVVLSLLPAPLHVDVAKLCIKHGASLVTASYTSPQMAQLDADAKKAGIVLLNELGLDPGIDHITAMRLIEEARSTGNKVSSFVSFCGGLPSPELSNGPLGYKFSWSPRGVLTAALNSASFRLSGRDVSIPSDKLLSQNFPHVPLLRGFAFEGVANRDSLSYLPEYGLPSDLPTILRGTLRYPGFARVVRCFRTLGLLSLEPLEAPIEKWTQLVDACARRLGIEHTAQRAVEAALADQPRGLVEETVQVLTELALLPGAGAKSTELPALPTSALAPLDYLSILLAHQLRYHPGERDAVVLHHEVTTRSDAGEDELFTSTLVQYGDDKASAMATTVGVPIALGALLHLDGKISQRGLVSPSSEEVWRPLLASLEAAGLRPVERRQKGTRGVLETLEATVVGGQWA
ncbi:Saccharopine dehydrogenase-domain-containing protein [Rhodotorula diobovata]|uniref:Saccharopine dehydrogenase-domain-containing protein n=1 Tax=Rhodotorula diobovata TaxID=5288 RepID=A0A5C5G6R4_9BASI|nr:Saccharopine dehydrogenase-domain-containing protein [Rhodotorula diobovata]